MRKVTIDQACFRLAFDRDVNFHDNVPTTTYLDLDTGGINWVYNDDEGASTEGITADDNLEVRNQIEAATERYLVVPGLDRGAHHRILKEFITSDWTKDKEVWNRAREAYFGSIGGWIKTVDDRNIVEAFYDFRNHKTQQLAEELLRENGIEPEWR